MKMVKEEGAKEASLIGAKEEVGDLQEELILQGGVAVSRVALVPRLVFPLQQL